MIDSRNPQSATRAGAGSAFNPRWPIPNVRAAPTNSATPGTSRAPRATCAVTKLIPVITNFGQDFTLAVGWPSPIEAQVVDDSFHAQPPFLKYPRGILQRLNTGFLVLGKVRERRRPTRVLPGQASIPLRLMIGEASRDLVEDDLRVGVHQHLLTPQTSKMKVMSRWLQIYGPKQNPPRIVGSGYQLLTLIGSPVVDHYNQSDSERDSREEEEERRDLGRKKVLCISYMPHAAANPSCINLSAPTS